jgi:protein-S-isoprenylcysteine O-methyltransferase Ste14
MPDRAAVIAPPPLLMLLCIAAGAIIDHFKPFLIIRDLDFVPRVAICIAILLVAAGLVFTAIRQFVTHHEHPSPYEPTNAIVSTGVYRFTRNPIYVGFLIVVIAAAVGFNSFWVLLSIVPLFLLLQFGVVLREEKYLSTKFGTAYDDYRSRVRRWI